MTNDEAGMTNGWAHWAHVAVLIGFLVLPLAARGGEERMRIEARAGAEWERIADAPRPSAGVARADAAPRIDGRLDDACWKAAKPIEVFHVLNNVPDEAKGWVSARFCCDRNALYLGARMAKPGGALKATVERNGGRIWSDDCIEFFIGSAAGDFCYQIDVNGLGAHWAGATRSVPAWEPSVRTAAVVGDKEWTVEVAVPWTDLGFKEPPSSSLAVDLRYLTGGGAGFSAWASGGKNPGEFGMLVFGGTGAAATSGLRFKRFLFPAKLPAGKTEQAFCVEAENVSDAPQQAIVRLADARTQQVIAQETATVAPRSTKVLGLPATVAAGEERRALLQVRGPTDRDLRTLAVRNYGAMPALHTSPRIERIWEGDASVECNIEVGRTSAKGVLRAELWDEVSRVAVAERAAPAGAYALGIAAADLPAGEYRLRVTHVSEAGEEKTVTPLRIAPTPKLTEKTTIPLRVQWPEGFSLSGDVPLYAGVAFPGGMLRSTEGLRVMDGEGREVPSQWDILARWTPNGSIKWAAARFAGRRDRSYSVEAGRGVTRAAAPGKALRVDDSAQAITVDTGVARFEMPKAGPLLRRAWLGDKLLLDGEGGCLIVTDQKGRVADERQGTASEAPVVESAGPICAVIRREGLLRTATGERLGKYVVRLTFSAGCSFVPVQHTFINTENTTQTQYADLAFRVRPAMGGAWKVEAATSAGREGKAFAERIDPRAGDGLYLLQGLYKHHYQPKCEYSVGLRRGKQEWKTVESGEVAGDWMCASGAEGGVALSVRWFAQAFPKELEAGPEGLTAHLWSSRGGRLLDYRATAVSEYCGPEWFERVYPGGLKVFNATYTDATGSARTHDLILNLVTPAASRAEVAGAAQLGSEPALALQDAEWLRGTDAMGPLHPYDPKSFPRIESFISKYFERVDRQADTAGDYGFLDYGSGPHTYTGGPAFAGRPRFYRYYDLDYQFRTVMWLLYARSGNRACYDYAVRNNRHLNDFLFCYWPARNKAAGALLTSGDGDSPLYWRSSASYWGSQGIDINNYLYQYFIGGDRRVVDGVRAYAEYMAANFDPLTLPEGIAGVNYPPYECLAKLYGFTWDERLGRLLRESRERVIDLDTTTGLANTNYYGAWYKPHTRVHATLEDYAITGSDLARRSLLKWFEHMIEQEPQTGPGYQDYDGLFANYAWRLTGDARFVSWAAERIARVEYSGTDEKGNMKGGPYDGSHLLTFLGSAPCALDLIARNRDKVKPWPALAAGGDVYFVKERGQTLRFDLRARDRLDLQVVRVFDRKDEEKRGGSYTGPIELDERPGYYSRDREAGTMPGYAQLRLAKEVLAGEYRLTGAATVLDTDAGKIVLAAPEGITLPVVSSRTPVWYFQLPKERKGAIFVSRPATLEWQGNRLEAPAGAWLALSGGQADALIALRAAESFFVRFQGDIPPVLAQDDPARFFLPAAGIKAVPLAELEDTKAEYVKGLTGAEGDRGCLLNGGRTLVIPRGKALDKEGRFEYMDARRGTLEFWFKPQWTTGMLPAGARKQVIRFNGWELCYEGGAFRFLGMAAVQVPPYQNQVLINRVALEQGRWYHLALCWDYDTTRKAWLSEFYVDGKPSGTDQARPTVGLSRCGLEDRQFTNLDVAVPSGPLTLVGDSEAVIDEIRVSSAARYPQPFAAPERRTFADDGDTLVLMHLDGDRTAAQRAVEARP